jgi:hypothetical protein
MSACRKGRSQSSPLAKHLKNSYQRKKSMTSLRLEPTSAAASIKARLETIAKCKAIILATVERYDGLKAFEAELARHNITDAVAKLRETP